MDNTEGTISNRQAVELVLLDLLNGDWAFAVLLALAPRRLPVKDVLDAVNSVDQLVGRRTHRRPLSKKILLETLGRMIDDGLVERDKEMQGKRTAVWYKVTPTGRELLTALRPLGDWARVHYRARLTPTTDQITQSSPN